MSIFPLTFSHLFLTAGDRCSDPGVPAGGVRTGNLFGIDDKVTYRCNGRLHLVGSRERVCQSDGQWTGAEANCYCKDLLTPQTQTPFQTPLQSEGYICCADTERLFLLKKNNTWIMRKGISLGKEMFISMRLTWLYNEKMH